MRIKLWINKNNIFLKSFQINIQKWIITGLIRKKSCKKEKERYSKEKAAEYYKENEEAIKENSKERYKNLSKEEKNKIKEYQKNHLELKKDPLKNK